MERTLTQELVYSAMFLLYVVKNWFSWYVFLTPFAESHGTIPAIQLVRKMMTGSLSIAPP